MSQPAAVSSNPAPHQPTRGTLWSLLAALPIAVVSPLSGCVFHTGDQALNHKATDTQSLGGPPNVKKLVLTNMVGEVEVIADPSASEVTADVTLEGRGRSDDAAQQALDEIMVSLEPSTADASVLEAKGHHPSDQRGRGHLVHWKIKAPPSVILVIETDVGEVNVSGFASGVTITTDVGDVRADQIGGGVTIVTNVGDVIAAASGTIHVTTDVGNATVSVLNAPSESISVKTDVGNVTLTLPPSCNATLSAEAGTGNVSVTGKRLQLKTERVDRDSFRGTIGDPGGPSISLETDVGNVTVTAGS